MFVESTITAESAEIAEILPEEPLRALRPPR
jgi:hypothetical protein